MSNDGNRGLIEKYVHGITNLDFESLRPLAQPDIVFDWPQTRERVHGVDRMVEIDNNYPGGLPALRTRRVVGAEDRWIVDATFTPRRISGSGDVWVVEADFRYPDGSEWAYCVIVEIRDGLIAHTTEYWAGRLPAPEWRAQWVESLPEE